MTFDATFTEVVPGRRNGNSSRSAADKPQGELSSTVVPSSMRGRKRLARIMEAAAELFLRDGYFATSIEAVLDASGGSKATLYSYFSTKDDLFRAVIEEAILNDTEPKLEPQADPRRALTEFLVQTFERISSPRHRALLRLTIAERERFPDLAQRYYEAGPMRARRLLAQFFGELEHKRVINPGTAERAADHFVGLVTQQWLLESLLFGEERLPPSDAVRDKVASAVDRFLTESRPS